MVKAITCDVQHLHRPERQTAALFGSRRAARAGARSCRALGGMRQSSLVCGGVVFAGQVEHERAMLVIYIGRVE